ncbi:MAG: DUF3800 domain-containing protein [Bacteroidales bacterium]|nr:DUF3800 domain-containing protein [Bacteroidales bacterium]
MYVDESGDSGTTNSPTRYFILSGLVIHELNWRPLLDDLVEFRTNLRETHGLKLRDEIHCHQFINKPGELIRIKRNFRVDIIKKCLDWLNQHPEEIRNITICVDKNGKQNLDVFELAWKALITRFENTIQHKNFPGPKNQDDKGLILSDNTDVKKITKLLRRIRHYNPIPNLQSVFGKGYRNMKIEYIIEDPILRDSKNSLLHQMVDVIAYSARQIYEPTNYMREKGGHRFYQRMEDVVLTKACKKNNLGIVQF